MHGSGVAKRIKIVRNTLGLTQDVFSDCIGITSEVLNDIEQRVVEPNEQVIDGVCQEFDIRRKWLKTGSGDVFIQDSPLMSIFSNRIRLLRLLSDLSQTKLASKLGISVNTISRYEDGSRTPRYQVIRLLCEEFCVSEVWLRFGNGEMYRRGISTSCISSSTDTTCGDRVKVLRTALGLTQANFGKAIGLTSTAISHYESNDRALSNSTIKAICSTFGVNELWLKFGDGDMLLPNPTDSIDKLVKCYKLKDDEATLIRRYLTLPADKRSTIMSYMQALIDC